MEVAVIALSVAVVVETLALGTMVPLLWWRVLKHDQQLDELDQVVEAIVEANRKRS